MRIETPLVSLFDYLGYAVGSELGQQVFEVAKKHNVPYEIRQVETKTYKGKVILYPKIFLNGYFK